MALPIKNFDTRKYVKQSEKEIERKNKQTSTSQQALSNQIVAQGIMNLNPNTNQMNQGGAPVQQQ